MSEVSRMPSPWLVALSRHVPYAVYELSYYKMAIEDALKARGVIDDQATGDFMRVGVDIAVAHNRALSTAHIGSLFPPEGE